jgi:ribosome-associated protein
MTLGQRFEMGYDIEPDTVPLDQDDTLPWVETIAAAADARKGEDVFAIRVSSLTTVSSFFVLVSGNSRPQIQAIAGAIEEDMLEKHDAEPRNGGEGTADSGWILLDYGAYVYVVGEMWWSQGKGNITHYPTSHTRQAPSS